MEHFLNCHGEWAAALAVLANLPFIGLYIRAHLAARRGGEA